MKENECHENTRGNTEGVCWSCLFQPSSLTGGACTVRHDGRILREGISWEHMKDPVLISSIFKKRKGEQSGQDGGRWMGRHFGIQQFPIFEIRSMDICKSLDYDSHNSSGNCSPPNILKAAVQKTQM